jgi:hypothetical protein
MAAPTPTARGTPSGIPLEDGYQILCTISGSTTVSFWEKMITPPGLDGGDPIDQTTQHNQDWRTSAPRSLITLGDMTVKAAYDPNVYNLLMAIINDKRTITNRWKDGSTLAFFGWVRSATPDEQSEGKQPEMTIVIHASNFDPTNHVEASPVLTSVSGT